MVDVSNANHGLPHLGDPDDQSKSPSFASEATSTLFLHLPSESPQSSFVGGVAVSRAALPLLPLAMSSPDLDLQACLKPDTISLERYPFVKP